MVALKASPYNFLAHEIGVFFSFSWRDWSTTLIPGSIFCIGAMYDSQLHPASILSNYLVLVLWLTLFVYFFNLSNQITGVDEDRINKPDRPIPSGKVTLAGARVRWVLALAGFLALALAKPALRLQTFSWIATAAFLCLTNAGNHWFGKNCVGMTAGTLALLSASWNAVAPATPQSQRYVLAIALWNGIILQIQDLRDIKGDTAIGRKTLPLVYGDERSRWIITFLLLPPAVFVLWLGDIVQIAPVTVLSVHGFLGWRVLQVKNSQYDHKTYMIFTYVFCLLLALTSYRSLEVNLKVLPGRSNFYEGRQAMLHYSSLIN